MKRLSLRLRLIIFFIAIACTVWAGAGILAWQETREKVDEFFDTYQMALARQLAGTDWSGITPEVQRKTDKLIENIRNADDEDEAIGFAVFDRSGRKIFHDDENGKDFQYQNISGQFIKQEIDDESWRLVWLKSADGKFRIAVGQELEYREDMAWDMLEEFTAPWAAGLVILLAAMIWLISRELRPLRRLAAEIGSRKADNLSPFCDDAMPSEIKPLTAAMNQQLTRISDMLARERRFISDAAHELRTPLTALKIQLDVARMSADDNETREASLAKLELGIDRATRLVEQLLALSRLEASLSAPQMACEPLDWKLICAQMIDEYHYDAETKKLQIRTCFEGRGPLNEGNPVLAALMLRNLIDNAVKYSPEGAEVRIRLYDNALEVTNSGAVVEESHLDKLGQRFFRPAGQNEKGSGLGLSIVKCIADFYGCKVSFANSPQGFRARIER